MARDGSGARSTLKWLGSTAVPTFAWAGGSGGGGGGGGGDDDDQGGGGNNGAALARCSYPADVIPICWQRP